MLENYQLQFEISKTVGLVLSSIFYFAGAVFAFIGRRDLRELNEKIIRINHRLDVLQGEHNVQACKSEKICKNFKVKKNKNVSNY
jgi:hypothetical protein